MCRVGFGRCDRRSSLRSAEWPSLPADGSLSQWLSRGCLLRRNIWECELTPEAVSLRRNVVNNMTVYITSCRGRLKPRPRTRFTFSSVALDTNRPRFYALVEQAHEFRQEDVGDPRVALEHTHALVVRGKRLQDVES